MLVIAHRTSSNAERCRQLADAGAGIFEVDVQLAAGQVVVSHFQPVWTRWPALQHDNWRLRLGASRRGDPRLSAVLAAIPAEARILLDPKESEPRRRDALVTALIDTVRAPTRYVVSSSWTDDLVRYRAAGLDTWRTVKTRAELRRATTEPVTETVVAVRHTLLAADVVADLHARQVAVTAWTVNDPGRARQLRGFGVDGVTTDAPAVMRELAGGADLSG